MNEITIDLFDILLSTAAGMALGALWYSPLAFGKAWMTAIGKTPEQLGSPKASMIGSVLACFVTALALSVIVSLTGLSGIMAGASLGAAIGIGIVFPAFLSDNLFCGWGRKLLWIQSGYRVVYIIVMAAIIAA